MESDMYRRHHSWTLRHPLIVIVVSLVVTALFVAQIPKIKIDTDPENMLEPDEPVRIIHNQMKRDFNVHDRLILGIVNEEGIFNPQSLQRVAELIKEILKIEGVERSDFLSPITTNDVRTRDGVMVVERMMERVPATQEEAEKLKGMVLDNPLFRDLLVAADGTGISIHVPIARKEMSHEISERIEDLASGILKGEEFHIAGLPVAEDRFGFEMFKQMGISAPLAGLIIFVLMWAFFKRVSMVIPPMFVAMFSVAWTMGLLIGLGYTVHIMSSMIPIFLMPIAVVDSIHVLSEFYDRYPRIRDRRETIRFVMDELFTPMLFTSLTSAAGFASLALTPIPPVRVFGLFVAAGIMMAWVLTITMIPASIILIPERWLLKGAGTGAPQPRDEEGMLHSAGDAIIRRGGTFLALALPLTALAIYGIARIEINDNPVRWFKPNHPIRVADEVMNRKFGGTYMANIIFKGKEADSIKDPAAINYMAELQEHLEKLPVVGKTSSIADVVERVNFVLHDESPEYYALPEGEEETAQYIFLYLMSSDDPGDLDRFVDYDYTQANLWLQLKRGDNRYMALVEREVNDYIKKNPLPPDIAVEWAGLTHINMIWQDRMVKGMMRSLMGSFITVLILMVALFRSFRWAALSMVPLTFTILLTYGFVGLVGKDYDMPIAVLSSLTLGLSIDFAIHFIQRFRGRRKETGEAVEALRWMFGEPARAILRNVAVISLGFIPLVFAPLVPYQTVGIYLASIMVISCVATLVMLPGLVRLISGEK